MYRLVTPGVGPKNKLSQIVCKVLEPSDHGATRCPFVWSHFFHLFPEVLAIALALLVLPAWKWFILPMPHGPHGSHGVDDHTPKIPRDEVKDEAQTSSKHRFFGRIGSSMSSLGETEMRRKFTQGFSTLSREDSVNLLTA